eukprot:m.50717 g.50717  ORF g.50717 m.50717 type:complete len:527 (-) comp6248_c0_seq2:813-2393(-)
MWPGSACRHTGAHRYGPWSGAAGQCASQSSCCTEGTSMARSPSGGSSLGRCLAAGAHHPQAARKRTGLPCRPSGNVCCARCWSPRWWCSPKNDPTVTRAYLRQGVGQGPLIWGEVSSPCPVGRYRMRERSTSNPPRSRRRCKCAGACWASRASAIEQFSCAADRSRFAEASSAGTASRRVGDVHTCGSRAHSAIHSAALPRIASGAAATIATSASPHAATTRARAGGWRAQTLARPRTAGSSGPSRAPLCAHTCRINTSTAPASAQRAAAASHVGRRASNAVARTALTPVPEALPARARTVRGSCSRAATAGSRAKLVSSPSALSDRLAGSRAERSPSAEDAIRARSTGSAQRFMRIGAWASACGSASRGESAAQSSARRLARKSASSASAAARRNAPGTALRPRASRPTPGCTRSSAARPRGLSATAASTSAPASCRAPALRSAAAATHIASALLPRRWPDASHSVTAAASTSRQPVNAAELGSAELPGTPAVAETGLPPSAVSAAAAVRAAEHAWSSSSPPRLR